MIWKFIFNHLTKNGIDVYSPNTYIGECKNKYVVLKKNGSNKHPEFSTNIDIYTILIYIPENQYSILDDYVQEIKEVMKKLNPMIKSHGLETGSYYDENKKAHTMSIDYRNYKKI